MGATFMKPIEIAKQVDVLILMLGYPHDVEVMCLDPEVGVLKHMRKGTHLIDHTTSSPELAQKIARAAREIGVCSIDAPVSGGDLGARKGVLVTMVGGEEAHVEYCREIIESYSCDMRHMGLPGAGHHTKSTNQIMVSA
jgi:3-hydroxyisobutyrate dehydrogenase